MIVRDTYLVGRAIAPRSAGGNSSREMEMGRGTGEKAWLGEETRKGN